MAGKNRAKTQTSSGAERMPQGTSDLLASLARSFGRSAGDAGELRREMSAAIARELEQLAPGRGAATRAGTAALEICRAHSRRRRLERGAAAELRRQGLPVAGEDLGEDLAEKSAQLEAALAQLETPGAELLRMCSLGGMSCSAVAGLLGVSPESVEESVVRTRSDLAVLLRPEAPDHLHAEHILHAEERRRTLWLASPSVAAHMLSVSQGLLGSLSRFFGRKT